jgi:hypothetical protein
MEFRFLEVYWREREMSVLICGADQIYELPSKGEREITATSLADMESSASCWA